MPEVPPWPDLADSTPGAAAAGVTWLRQVWAIDHLADAIEHASPALDRQVRALCAAEVPPARKTRRAVLSVVRYLHRMTGRATPFGLLAGVASASFASPAQVRWGTDHRPVARAAAEWLAGVLARLEDCPELLARLPVVANTTLMVRGDRLVVPYQPQARARGIGAVEVSLRYTAVVHAVIEAASTPIQMEDLAATIQADHPTAPGAKITAMLTELVQRGALLTSVRAPSTEPDALGHLVDQLDAVGAPTLGAVGGLATAVREVHSMLERHNQTPAAEGRQIRVAASTRMRELAPTTRHPLALDLRLDGTFVLPEQVAREVEHAAWVLTRLSAYPVGTPTWRGYHQRFYERFGIGSLVPLREVIGDSGIGWPDGYPGTVVPEPRSPMSSRDETLLGLAQRAALDGLDEVVVDEHLISALRLGPTQHRPPAHLEIGVRIRATSHAAMACGDFLIEVLNVSRAAGVLTGRFLSVLDPEGRTGLARTLTDLPGTDGDTVAAQLSFPPLDPATAHVTRAMPILPTVVSLAEYRTADERVLTIDDLAVGCDGHRMYLAAPARGLRVEAAGAHALNLKTHTPPLARFLIELSRAQCAQVTVFSWGAAGCLPFLPRLRYGRTVLSPARWRLEASDLPARGAPLVAWERALTVWRAQRRVPGLVYLAEGDRLLPLDLDRCGHRVLLRTHLASTPHAVLIEAPGVHDTNDWCGGRAHELIVPVVATEPASWPPLPTPTGARVVGREHTHTPAVCGVMLASLYGDVHRQDTILSGYLPALLAEFDEPAWWYIRYRDPDHHLRLRFALTDPARFGEMARAVSTWAEELNRIGLVRDLRYPTSHPEIGRWGSGPAWAAAEEVFRADSRALLVQLGQLCHPHRLALTAAHTVAITIAFTGSATAGMRWLLDHVPATAPTPVPRPVFAEAVRLADPRGGWACLRAAPGGAAIHDVWPPRETALAAYRRHLDGPHTQGIAVDDVLRSLLHANFVRASGIDFDGEATGLYLARAAALAWTARTTGRQP
ncbi:MAG: lantibiotic dehydratase [Actinobacteria bacterium]|nr:lantibiotic dehydratase [Actinomycetota bacterium]